MRLAHPGQAGSFIDFYCTAPEAFKDIRFDFCKGLCSQGFAGFSMVVYAALILCFKQVCDKVMIIRSQKLQNDPAAHLGIVFIFIKKMLCKKHFIHG